jgi:hypothetical protein
VSVLANIIAGGRISQHDCRFLDMTAVLALILANFEYSPSSEEEIIALETSIM